MKKLLSFFRSGPSKKTRQELPSNKVPIAECKVGVTEVKGEVAEAKVLVEARQCQHESQFSSPSASSVPKLKEDYERRLETAENGILEVADNLLKLKATYEDIPYIKRQHAALQTLIAECKKCNIELNEEKELIASIDRLAAEYEFPSDLKVYELFDYDDDTEQAVKKWGSIVPKEKLSQDSAKIEQKRRAVNDVLRPITDFLDKMAEEIRALNSKAKMKLVRRKQVIQVKKELLQAQRQQFNGLVDQARLLIPKVEFPYFPEYKVHDIPDLRNIVIPHNQAATTSRGRAIPFSQQLEERIERSHKQLSGLSKNLEQARTISLLLARAESLVNGQRNLFLQHMCDFRKEVERHAWGCDPLVTGQLKTIKEVVESLIQSTQAQLAACNPLFTQLDVDIKERAKSEISNLEVSSLFNHQEDSKAGRPVVPLRIIDQARIIHNVASSRHFFEFSENRIQRDNHARRYFWLLCAQTILTELSESKESKQPPDLSAHWKSVVLLLYPVLLRVIQTDRQLREVSGIDPEIKPEEPSLWQSVLNIFHGRYYTGRAIQAIHTNHDNLSTLNAVNTQLLRLIQPLSRPARRAKLKRPDSHDAILHQLDHLQSQQEVKSECKPSSRSASRQ